MRSFNLHNQDGFTLIEVIVSIILFVIGILGLMALQVFAVKGAYLGNRTTEAVELANSMVNVMQATPYNPVNPGIFTPGSHPQTGEGCLQCPSSCQVTAQGTCGASYNYKIAWNVAQLSMGTGSVVNDLRITITVSWVDGSLPRSVTMYTSKLPF
ncbi:MAG: type IV pilus modification PilV family protein [bacterium]